MDEMPQQPPASGSKNKMWMILGVIILLLLAGWWAFSKLGRKAGEKAVEGAIEKAAGGKADVNYNNDGSVDIKTDEGSASTSGQLPDNWPNDVPVYTDSAITYSGSTNPQTGAAGAAIIFTNSASAKTILDYYKKELTAQGWTIDQSATSGGVSVLSAAKDQRKLGLAITENGGLSQATLGIEMPAANQ